MARSANTVPEPGGHLSELPDTSSIEAAIALAWRPLIGDAGRSVSIEHFGASAPGPTVLADGRANQQDRADGDVAAFKKVTIFRETRRRLTACQPRQRVRPELPRAVRKAAAEERSNFVPTVRVAAVRSDPSDRVVNLPGTTLAFAAANIYARASGYIAKRNVDIGDRVKAGDLLAELAVPELDHQISQNEATLDQLKSSLQQARANRDLAQVTWDRDSPLVQKG